MRFWIITILLFITNISLLADDGFFKEGFVVPTAKEKRNTVNQNSKSENPKNIVQDIEVDNIIKEDSGIKAYSISLIVNAYDQPHFIKHFRNAIKTAAHYDLKIAQIIAVGLIPERRELENLDFFSRKAELFSLKVLDGKLLPTYTIPKRFNVKKSPSWIINTSEGSMLIEGKDEIWEFLNSKGEYIERGFIQRNIKDKT